MSRIEKLHHTGPRDLMRISLSHWALALALALAVLPHAGSAGVKQASLSPMFDAHTRFKPNEIAKLRFRVQDGSGAPVPEKDVTFSLRHGPKDAGFELPARAVKAGIFEVPFTPEGPGQYAIYVAVRGTQVGSIAPVRLAAVDVEGLVELSIDKDAGARQRAKNVGWRVQGDALSHEHPHVSDVNYRRAQK
jgi:hypothetical protein